MASTPTLSLDEMQDQLDHLHDNKAPQMVAASISFIVISTVAVILRLVARRMQKIRLGSDDYMIVVSLVLAFGMFINFLYAVEFGMGRHVIIAGLENAPKAAEALYVFEILFPASNTASKISTLLLYKRVFGGTCNRPFLRSIYLLSFLWTLLFIAGTCCTVFQCGVHFDLAWTTLHGQGCLDLSDMIFALTVVSVIFNVFTVAIPLPFISNLHLSPKAKLGVFLIFIIGCGDIGVSIARAKLTHGDMLVKIDFTWLQVDMVMLAFSEPCVGIVCTCLVLMRPIFIKSRAVMTSLLRGGRGSSGSRFPLESDNTPGRMTSVQFFTPPAVWTSPFPSASLAHSVRSRLDSVASVLTPRNGSPAIPGDELRRPQDAKEPEMRDSGVCTHPWRMDTFESFGKKNHSAIVTRDLGGSAMSPRTRPLALDKPLPPIPDDVSSLSGSRTEVQSIESFS